MRNQWAKETKSLLKTLTSMLSYNRWKKFIRRCKIIHMSSIFIRKQFNNIAEDWRIKIDNTKIFLVKLSIIFLFQLLSFVWKPFIVFELLLVVLIH